MVLLEAGSQRRTMLILFAFMAISGTVALLASGILRSQDFLMSSLLNQQSNEGIVLQVDQPEQTKVGDTIKVALQVRSPREISKVVASLYYNPKVLRYEGHAANGNAYMGYMLSQAKPDAGWLYFADGRKNPSQKPQDETFVTLTFQAIAPGKTELKLDPDISKFAVGKDFTPAPLKDGFVMLPDAIQEIAAPTFLITTNAGSNYLKTTSLPLSMTVQNLGTANTITSYKMREETGAWTASTAKPFAATATEAVSEGDGLKRVFFLFQDAFGNQYESRLADGKEPYMATLYLDRKGPDISKPAAVKSVELSTGNSMLMETAFINSKTPTIAWRYLSEDLTGIAKLNLVVKGPMTTAGETVTGTSTILKEQLQDGVYTAELQAEDNVGNSTTVTSDSFTVDTVAPRVMTLTLKSEASDINPVFIYGGTTEASSGLATLGLKITRDNDTTAVFEQETAANAANTITLGRGLANGKYQAHLKATDRAGNTSSYEKLLDFNIQGTSTGTVLESMNSGLPADKAEINRLRTEVAGLSAALNAGNNDLRRLNSIVNAPAPAKATPAAATTTTTTSTPTRAPVLSNATTQTNFRDLGSDHWAYSYMNKLRDQGVLNGYGDNTMRPNDNITRAELLKVVLTANKTNTENKPAAFFKDTKITDWYAPYLNTATAMGILRGYTDGTVRPNNPITRAEALKIILEANKVAPKTTTASRFNDVNPSDWFAGYITAASDLGIVQGYGDGGFHPYQPVTRAEAAKIVSTYLQ